MSRNNMLLTIAAGILVAVVVIAFAIDRGPQTAATSSGPPQSPPATTGGTGEAPK